MAETDSEYFDELETRDPEFRAERLYDALPQQVQWCVAPLPSPRIGQDCGQRGREAERGIGFRDPTPPAVTGQPSTLKIDR